MPTRKTKAAVAGCAAVVATAAIITATSGSDTSEPPTAAPPALISSIESLPVAPEENDGYKRTSFRHWLDEDKDGCDTRMEVLMEESLTQDETNTCKHPAGPWESAYDGKQFTDPRGLDIDHFVPLKEAWGSGAWDWEEGRRNAYANDLNDNLSLIAVSAATNRAKADKDPAQWMPPREEARCAYITIWVHVKKNWGLSVDEAEKKALLEKAEGCPGSDLPQQ